MSAVQRTTGSQADSTRRSPNERPNGEQDKAFKAFWKAFDQIKPNQFQKALADYDLEQGRYIGWHRDNVSNEKDRHNKDPLTDDQQEMVSIWIRKMPQEMMMRWGKWNGKK